MRILIVGGGKVGYYLAKRLKSDKHVVSLVEKDAAICRKISRDLDILVINGDGCDRKFLEEADINHRDVVVALTGDDEDNIIICQIAKELYNVSRTVSRVNDSDNEHTFSELGVDVPIDSTEIIAKIIEEEVSFADLATLMTFRRGKLAIVRVDLDSASPVVDKMVKDVVLPPDSVLVAIVRGEMMIVPRGDTVFQKRDDVIALTVVENKQELLETLVGKIKG
ncbi:MAG: NAD-binding protein [Candidatus Omnitrophica bacterium]|nr:NAD-binding protein [Candidatus Omnitrophota bacterium]MBU4478234.1 NAD-binding protein [Candidatus Omnitrophota bacterium]MCG2703302.1 NAD-binding protein [Candidatus Omnitrophota bacterium]